jgi:hypothetical protein
MPSICLESNARRVVVRTFPPEIHFDDRGEHKLKGVPGTWKVFSVRR